MTSLVRPRRQFTISRLAPLCVIVLVLLLGGYLWVIHENVLALLATTYGIILIQARIPFIDLLRRVPGKFYLITAIRFLVFLPPLFILGASNAQLVLWGIIAGIGWGLLLQLLQFRDLTFVLSKEFIRELPPLPLQEKVLYSLQLVLVAIGQEYFYRGVVLYVLISSVGIWAIVISSLLFTFEHVMHFNAAQVFDKYDIMLQTALAVGLGVIFYFSGSLIGCMLGHSLYNGPTLLQTLRRKTGQRNASLEVTK